MKDFAPAGPGAARHELVREWNEANDYCIALLEREAGAADQLEWRPLGRAMAEPGEELQASAQFRHAFDTLPTRLAMVELGRMVVCQNHVNCNFVDQLKAELGPDPGAGALFRFCLPTQECRTSVKARAEGSRRYVFRSSSTDLRHHETLLLRPGQVQDYPAQGAIAGVIGVVVGYGSNYLNALYDDDHGRMVLNDGYHRACALLELGVTHAPCIVQTVSRRDELDIAARQVVANDPGYFFNGPRPPLLRDYADPHIAKLVAVKRLTKTVEVSIDVREFYVEQ